VTDFVAVVPREPAAAAQATTELLSGLAKARNSA